MRKCFHVAISAVVGVLSFGTMSVAQRSIVHTPSTKSAPAAVPSNPVTINIPEGISKDQAVAILDELRQIRHLLEKQQPAAGPLQGVPELADNVSLSISSDWYSLGREDAPVTVVEFSDYQCPFCRRFHTDAFLDLKKNYIDTGKVRFVSRDLPLDFHDNADRAAEAARCAGDQGKFWEMRDELITNSNALDGNSLSRYAQSLALDIATFQNCVSQATHKAEIQKDEAEAKELQISGTPTFVLARTSGKKLTGVRLVGAQPYSTFDATIRQLLASRTP